MTAFIKKDRGHFSFIVFEIILYEGRYIVGIRNTKNSIFEPKSLVGILNEFFFVTPLVLFELKICFHRIFNCILISKNRKMIPETVFRDCSD